MPPKKLTVDDQAYITHWSRKMAYFMKMMRRANLYILDIPREAYKAAYDEVLQSGFVALEERGQGNIVKRKSWEPKREDRDAYLDYMQTFIDRHPPTSPRDAVYLFFASNAGAMCVMRIVTDKSQRVQDKFWEELHKLNNQDLEVTKEERFRLAEKYGSGAPVTSNNIGRDHVEGSSNRPHTLVENDDGRDSDEDSEPFVRSRPFPQDPTTKITPTEWKQFEQLGETYFVKDQADKTGFTAFELTAIVVLKKGKSYKMRYEDCVDSFRITEKELLAIIEDGVWV